MSPVTSSSAARPAGRIQRLPSGYDMHYQERGDGPPVVFVHGSGPGASAYVNFKPNYAVIADAGFRSVLPDMLGFGKSSKPAGIDYTLDLFANSLLDLLDALAVNRCTLVGNSLGGAVSLKLAIDYPERVDKLVLMAPGGIEQLEVYFRMPGIQKMMSGFVDEGFDRAGLRRLLELLAFDPRVVTDELLDERFEVLQTQPKDVLARMRIPDLSPRLGEVKCPVLGFWGIDDQFCPSSGHEKILRAVADSRFLMLARCGHWAMIEHAAEFNKHVIDFLRR